MKELSRNSFVQFLRVLHRDYRCRCAAGCWRSRQSGSSGGAVLRCRAIQWWHCFNPQLFNLCLFVSHLLRLKTSRIMCLSCSATGRSQCWFPCYCCQASVQPESSEACVRYSYTSENYESCVYVCVCFIKIINCREPFQSLLSTWSTNSSYHRPQTQHHYPHWPESFIITLVFPIINIVRYPHIHG